jgi:hypothetical protein
LCKGMHMEEMQIMRGGDFKIYLGL